MSFDNSVVPEDWRSAMIVPIYKGKGEALACKAWLEKYMQ